MPLGLDTPLYLLPFRHHFSFQVKMFGSEGTLTPGQTADITRRRREFVDVFEKARVA